MRLPQRLFPLSSIALFVLLFAGLCPAVSADVGEQGDIIAKLSIDLNNDGYNENIEILRTSDIDMRVRLIRGTKNGQIIDLSESLPFGHLVGLTVYPIMGATYPRAIVIQGTAGAHRSFLNVYYIGEDGRFSKLFECSGDGGEFVLVRREIGYHFTGKFVYPRDPETVAAAYVEAAVLGLDHELKQYIGARFDDERVWLERLGDLLHKRFGDFTGICVSTPSELKSLESWAPKVL